MLMINFKNPIYIIAIFFLASCATIYLWSSFASKNNLTLGVTSGQPPYVFFDEKGYYQGLDIDIAKELAKQMNKRLVIIDLDSNNLILCVLKNKIDMIMSGLAFSDNLSKKIKLIPYDDKSIYQVPLVFWGTRPLNIKSIHDVFAHSDRITNAYSALETKNTFFSKCASCIIKDRDFLTAFLEIKYGKTLATFLDPYLYRFMKQYYPNLTAVSVSLKKRKKIKCCAIGVNKNNIKLINDLKKAIKELNNTGFIDKTRKKWLEKNNKN